VTEPAATGFAAESMREGLATLVRATGAGVEEFKVRLSLVFCKEDWGASGGVWDEDGDVALIVGEVDFCADLEGFFERAAAGVTAGGGCGASTAAACCTGAR